MAGWVTVPPVAPVSLPACCTSLHTNALVQAAEDGPRPWTPAPSRQTHRKLLLLVWLAFSFASLYITLSNK